MIGITPFSFESIPSFRPSRLKSQNYPMMFVFLLLIFAGTAAALWFQGLWSAAVTLVNLLLAMMIGSERRGNLMLSE